MILGQSPVLPASYGSPLVLPHKKSPNQNLDWKIGECGISMCAETRERKRTHLVLICASTPRQKKPTRMKPPRARMRKSAPRGGGSDPPPPRPVVGWPRPSKPTHLNWEHAWPGGGGGGGEDDHNSRRADLGGGEAPGNLTKTRGTTGDELASMAA